MKKTSVLSKPSSKKSRPPLDKETMKALVKKMPPVDKMDFPGLNTYTLRGKVSPKVLAGLGKNKKKLTDIERLDIARKEALLSIYKFYARQHIKNGITFDE